MTAIKKKIIKKVPKKNSGAREAADNTFNKDEEQNIADAGNSDKAAADVGKQNDEVDKHGLASKPLEPVAPVKKDGSDEYAKAETKGKSKNVSHKDSHGTKNLKEREKANSCRDKRDAKLDESAQKSDEDPKGKKRLEEPSRPGFILCTKGSKDQKPSSLSVSLDSLLDYSDKGIEESNFELSLFAESLYEMLQYQMGYRVLDFLQKLRDRFIRKTNQQKRKREETDNANVKRSSKLTKTSDVPSSDTSIKSASDNIEEGNSIMANILPDYKIAGNKSNCANNTQPDIKTEEKGSATAYLIPNGRKESNASNLDHVDDTQMLDVLDGEHEEDPDKYEVEEETSQPDDAPKEDKINNTGIEQVVGDIESTGAAEPTSTVEDTMIVESQPRSNDGPIPDKKDEREETKDKSWGLKKEDKELMQAFHFFDRNRSSYIRVEDMRLIIHSLGKFLSHRDVKELVQTALLSSNNGRDDRIFYGKLIRRMSNG